MVASRAVLFVVRELRISVFEECCVRPAAHDAHAFGRRHRRQLRGIVTTRGEHHNRFETELFRRAFKRRRHAVRNDRFAIHVRLVHEMSGQRAHRDRVIRAASRCGGVSLGENKVPVAFATARSEPTAVTRHEAAGGARVLGAAERWCGR